jgi:hypothetical protein
MVGSASWTEGGSKLGGGTFEPRDDHKGDVARSMFYFVLRYQDFSNFLDAQEAILRTWYLNDLPSTKEIKRNEDIFKYQKNRNPFVDHPLFLNRISSIGATAKKTEIKNLRFTVDGMRYSYIDPYYAGCQDTCSLYVPYYNAGNTRLDKIEIQSKGNIFLPRNYATTLEAGEGHDLELKINKVHLEAYSHDTLYLLSNGSPFDTLVVNTGFSGINGAKPFNAIVHFNPESNELSIVMPASGKSDLELVNTQGQKVYHRDTIQARSTHQLSALKSGVYYLRICEGLQPEVHKILIPEA